MKNINFNLVLIVLIISFLNVFQAKSQQKNELLELLKTKSLNFEMSREEIINIIKSIGGESDDFKDDVVEIKSSLVFKDNLKTYLTKFVFKKNKLTEIQLGIPTDGLPSYSKFDGDRLSNMDLNKKLSNIISEVYGNPSEAGSKTKRSSNISIWNSKSKNYIAMLQPNNSQEMFIIVLYKNEPIKLKDF